MASSSPRASSQVVDHTPSPSAPLDHTTSLSSLLDHHTSLPRGSHTNQPTLSKEESAMETKSSQAGFRFLSLPPEIRNMIYHYIFVPVRDGTCRRVHIHPKEPRLKGIRSSCFICRSALPHTTCQPGSDFVTGMYCAFDIIGSSTHPGILQTCNTTLEEALPISLGCLHISLCWPHGYVERALVSLLANMRQPKGAYVSTFTCKYYTTFSADGGNLRCFSQLINRTGIRIGHLFLCEITESAYLDIGKHLIATLDRLDHKPASVERTPLTTSATRPSRYGSKRVEFNEAAGRWLARLATVKAADPNARLPLLRDFLPQYFEGSSD
jgi:hypothetical protein